MNYHIHKGEQKLGPFPEDQVRQMLDSGMVGPGDLCWWEGLATWVPLSQELGQVSPAGERVNAPVRYAGFWYRVLAALLDNLLLLVPGFFVGAAIGFVMGAQGATQEHIQLVARLAGVTISWLYFATLEASSYQATPGKLVLNIQVTDLAGGRIGFGRATGRYFGKFLSALLFGIGFIMAGFTSRKQTLHDMMAGCLVIRQ